LTPESYPPPRNPYEQPKMPHLEPLFLNRLATHLPEEPTDWDQVENECGRYWNAAVESGRETVRPGSRDAGR
jgi:hypothetical protein